MCAGKNRVETWENWLGDNVKQGWEALPECRGKGEMRWTKKTWRTGDRRKIE